MHLKTWNDAISRYIEVLNFRMSEEKFIRNLLVNFLICTRSIIRYFLFLLSVYGLLRIVNKIVLSVTMIQSYREDGCYRIGE